MVGNFSTARWTTATFGFAVVLCLAGEWIAQADTPPHPRDRQLKVFARHALQSDPRIAALNLFVRVEEGVAIVSGPIPSPELGEVALKLVRKVRGIREVRSELQLTSPSSALQLNGVLEELARSGELELPGYHFLTPSSDQQYGLPPWLQHRPGETAPEERLTAQPERRQESSPAPGVSLGAPVSLMPVQPRTGPVSLLSPTAYSPVQTVSRPDPSSADLHAAIEGLRDGQLALLRVEIRNGMVILSGSVQRLDALFDFARAIARLPGVREVDLSQVRSWP